MISIKRLGTLLSIGKSYENNLKNYHLYKVPDYRSYNLAEELVKNLIYYDQGIVVINKPYGISFAQNSNSKGEQLTIDTIRPFLLKKLNCSELFSAKVPERYASGVSIFCTNDIVLKRVQKCLRSMKGNKNPAQFYECIAIGQPSVGEGKFDGGITVETSPNGKQKGIKLVQKCSSNRVRKGQIKPVLLQHSTLSFSDCASRLIISTTTTKWHSVRVYAARELISPILGDHIFGKSVRRVLGKPVLIEMFSPVAGQPQKLPNELLSKLELSSRNDIDIPLHLHLTKIRLNNFLGINKHLEFIAQPPDYFLWTCEALNLNKIPDIAALN